MVHEYDLGDVSQMSNDEIAEAVREKISERGDEPTSFVYRGLSCSNERLEAIRVVGTDRTAEGWEKAASKFLRMHRKRGINREEALESTDPKRIFAATSNQLEDAVESTDDGADPAVILAYRTDCLRRLTEVFPQNPEYEFVADPKRALDSIFRFAL